MLCESGLDLDRTPFLARSIAPISAWLKLRGRDTQKIKLLLRIVIITSGPVLLTLTPKKPFDKTGPQSTEKIFRMSQPDVILVAIDRAKSLPR